VGPEWRQAWHPLRRYRLELGLSVRGVLALRVDGHLGRKDVLLRYMVVDNQQRLHGPDKNAMHSTHHSVAR
jgi:hypothetical protein